MARKKNILQEAIADAKALREGATKSAEAVLMEQLKDGIRGFVDSKLNEEYEDSADVKEKEDMDYDETVSEEVDDLEVDDDELGEEEEDEGSDDFMADLEDEDDEDGLTEAEFDEVLNAALQEVDHGDLGEMDLVGPDEHADSKGLDDLDSKEKGWEEKDVPAKEDWTVKEAAYRKKIARLVKESMLQKKAIKKLRESVRETSLFNHKLLYTTQLLQTEGLSNKVKKEIINSIDGATTFTEAKQTFNTWKSAIKVISENAKTSSRKVSKGKSLSEAVLGSRGKEEGRGISKLDDSHLLYENRDPYDVNRMKVLSGIIKE